MSPCGTGWYRSRDPGVGRDGPVRGLGLGECRRVVLAYQVEALLRNRSARLRLTSTNAHADMRGVEATRFGGPEVLKLHEVATSRTAPAPGIAARCVPIAARSSAPMGGIERSTTFERDAEDITQQALSVGRLDPPGENRWSLPA